MSLLSNELHTAVRIALQAAELVRQYNGSEIKVDFKDGVKLEDQVLITESGPVWLSRFPFDAVLSN